MESPHVVVIQFTAETYEMHPNGHYNPNKKTKVLRTFVLKGSTESICQNRLNTLLDLLNKETDTQNDSDNTSTEGLINPPVSGSSGTLAQHPQMLRLPNGFAGRSGH